MSINTIPSCHLNPKKYFVLLQSAYIEHISHVTFKYNFYYHTKEISHYLVEYTSSKRPSHLSVVIYIVALNSFRADTAESDQRLWNRVGDDTLRDTLMYMIRCGIH